MAAGSPFSPANNCVRPVVVPYDFSERARADANCVRDVVTDLTDLHVIHVLPTITVSDPGMIWDVVDNDARKQDAEKTFREQFARSRLGKCDFQVVFGDPGHEVASFAERLKADLIVMPSHGRSGVTRLLIGSVAERVVPPGTLSCFGSPRFVRQAYKRLAARLNRQPASMFSRLSTSIGL